MGTNRRDFIRFVVAGAVAAGCPVDLRMFAADKDATPVVEGEHNEICHEVRDGKKFDLPPVSGRHDVVVVGAGVSGLYAAHLLGNHDFLLLEKEPHFGGNAYEESFNGTIYATGAAFTDVETAAQLKTEFGLKPLRVDNWDGSILKGKHVPDTWGAGLDHLPYSAAVRDAFKKFRQEMLAIDYKSRAAELDNLPLSNFLQGYPPEIKQWWDAYGPSNWGGAADISSAMVAIAEMHFMAGPDRKDERITWPGGNGAITHQMVEVMKPKYGDRMLDNATTVAVVPSGSEVKITYIRDGQLKTVAAKSVIMATPKFITLRIVEGIPDKQKQAMRKIRYAPYPVINLIFDKPVFNKGYDTWCPGNRFTDFIVADWTVRKEPGYKQKYNILTFYTPMAEDDRGYLLTEESSRKIAERVLHDFQKLFPGSNVNPVEVHMYRRGHPMFIATPGNYTQVLPLVREPMERVFFANTDSEGPVSGTDGGIRAARRAVKEMEQRLAGRPRHLRRRGTTDQPVAV
jgi:monoamine oxidase